MTDQERMYQELLERMDDITEIKVALGVMTSTMQQMQVQQQALFNAITGADGGPGLEERMRNLEAAQTSRGLTCPLLMRIQVLEQYRETSLKTMADIDAEVKERQREWRMMKIGLVASIIMLILSTAIRLLIP